MLSGIFISIILLHLLKASSFSSLIFPKCTYLRFSHPSNVSNSITFKFSGKTTSPKLIQSANALLPIFVTEDGNSTNSSIAQFLKAPSSIVVKDLLKCIFFKLIQYRKASACIIFTLSGIYNSTIKILPIKAPSIISVVPSGIFMVIFLFTFSTIPHL